MNDVSQPPTPPKPKLLDRVRRAIKLGVALVPVPLAAPAHGPPLPLSPSLDSMARPPTALPPQPPQQRADREVTQIGPQPD